MLTKVGDEPRQKPQESSEYQHMQGKIIAKALGIGSFLGECAERAGPLPTATNPFGVQSIHRMVST